MDQIEGVTHRFDPYFGQVQFVEHPIEACAHLLFEGQVERTPDAVALHFAGKQLTYQELNRRANQLARHLRRLEIGPEAPIGICLERLPEMIVAILGVLKAGGAFVPLDPAYPGERLAFMLDDARVALLITQQSLVERFTGHTTRTVTLDTDRETIGQHKTHNLEGTGYPDNLAYVIYTSGSTGKPKGVMVMHRGMCNLFLTQKHAFRMNAQSRILQFASLSFDASVWEIFMALLSGATLHLETREALLPGASLVEVLQQQGITIATLPPSALAILPAEELPALQVLITAGEACPANLVARWAPGRHFFNAYGPTETTVCATIALCEDGRTNPPIGRPIANMQVHVLDEALRPVPAGVSGQIYIGGPGLARGYIRRPELTAERFIPDPFAQEPGSRLYKTGDLARYRADGQIEFLGRIDSQVKLRGFRIELGEIEAILNAHRAVREAVVVVREDEPGDARLVAYLIPHREQGTMRKELRDDLKATLPDYMLPGTFVVLNEWPLTSNGKIDRRALPMPDATMLALLEPFTAPRTPHEEALARIWCETLRLDRVGIHDSFFNLGGHSLLATQIATRVRSTFQVELPLASLFTHPTIAELAQYIEQQRSEIPLLRTSSIQLLPRVSNLPLSFSQERVWFLQQLDPTNMAYNAQAMLRLTGWLDVEALERSLSEIIRRHEIFRTTFPAVDGRPIQHIHQAQPLKILLIDLQVKPEHERELAAQQLMDEEFQKPFDVTHLPLVRWTLLRLSEQEHIFVHVEHHLVHDGWSFSVFLRELQALYTAFATGKPSSLPELTLQFADFAQWQRQWMKGEEAEAQLTYWKQKLAGVPTLLALPADHPRPAVLGFKGAVQRVALPASLCEALRSRCRQEGVTLYMLLLAAFLTLLYRYTNQKDLCVGTGIANRRWQETEPLIGMIINTLALRTDLSGNPTYRELLKRVQDVTLEAYAHQDLPFGTVVEALHPERSLSHSPLYQALFSFHDSPLPDLNLPNLKVKVTEGLSNHSAKSDLSIVVIPRVEQLVGMQAENEEKAITFLWEYNTDLFEQTTIKSMATHFQVLLESIVANPDQQIIHLPLLTEVEAHLILTTWNETRTRYPRTHCIQQLFEAQTEQRPDAMAVVFGEDTLTYREVNRQANQLAHYLQRRSVSPDGPVGICMERSAAMVVAMLGVLKAGGAYMPLDPAYPRERLAYVLQDAQVPILLTQSYLLADVPSYQGTTVYLDRDRDIIARQDTANLPASATLDDVAYVIYTSGSTGYPKGVEITHASLLNLVYWHQNAFAVTAADRATQVTSPAFDATGWELWPYFTAGASIYFPDKETCLSPSDLRDWLLCCSISISFLPTALAESVLPLDWPGIVPLRFLLTGADVLHHYPPAGLPFALVNNYGPTEATVVTTSGIVPPNAHATRLPSIGRAIANMQVYILDEQLQPVPTGVPGELYIGGAGLARGYLNRPALTAERFVPHPFSTESGQRLYKTGDLVRFFADGSLAFIGRIDSQVKLRGFRIELGEIEDVLNHHPAVQENVVVLQEEVSGEKRLVAYVVLRSEQMAMTASLRSFLQERLPEYMIPAQLLFLDQLPLTSNGKVDRNALPRPDWDRTLLEEAFVAPRNAIEEEVARIWCEVLGVEKAGIHDNFFDLGGHSLLATQMVSRIGTSFEVELSLRSFFEVPTVAGLALAVVQQQANEVDSELLTQLLAEIDQTA